MFFCYSLTLFLANAGSCHKLHFKPAFNFSTQYNHTTLKVSKNFLSGKRLERNFKAGNLQREGKMFSIHMDLYPPKKTTPKSFYNSQNRLESTQKLRKNFFHTDNYFKNFSRKELEKNTRENLEKKTTFRPGYSKNSIALVAVRSNEKNNLIKNEQKVRRPLFKSKRLDPGPNLISSPELDRDNEVISFGSNMKKNLRKTSGDEIIYNNNTIIDGERKNIADGYLSNGKHRKEKITKRSVKENNLNENIDDDKANEIEFLFYRIEEELGVGSYVGDVCQDVFSKNTSKIFNNSK